MWRLILAGLASVGAIGLFAASGASGENPLTCFGEPATIVGSGTISGTPGNDVIVGSNGNDVIDGLAGNDRICALDGIDLAIGVDAAEHAAGGTGRDFLGFPEPERRQAQGYD